jgi:flagellar basal body L-ring protein FlgH
VNSKSLLLLICAFTLFCGCSDLIRSMREESGQTVAKEEEDQDSDQPAPRQRQVHGMSANNTPQLDAPANRAYGRRLASRLEADNTGPQGGPSAYSPPPEFHRATREDFVDKAAAENSLWDAQGQANYLFSNNRRREMGDLVTADVEKDLRREIQFQLWMTLPPEQRMIRKGGGDALTNVASGNAKPGAPADKAAAPEKSTEQKQKDAAEEAAKTNMAPAGKEDDVVKMEVVENMGNGLVRVLGQKRVIYRGVSRLVEVVALVNNKDIDDTNRVKSSAFLDAKVQVIQ